jgi:hypothetical protein
MKRIVITLYEAKDVSDEHFDLNCVVQGEGIFLASCTTFGGVLQHVGAFLDNNLR